MAVPADKLVLTTQRLVLRPLEAGDADALQALAGDIEIARWTSDIPHPYSVEEAAAFIAHAGERARFGEAYANAIVGDNGLVGTIEVRRGDDGEGEVGYWIGRPYQGRGYASEAVQAMLAFAVRELALPRIWARVALDNHASIRVLEKNGLRLKGRGKQFWKARNREVAIARYAILAKDLKR